MSLFELAQSTLDRRLLVSGDLVAVLLQLLLGGEDVRVGSVDLLDALLLLLILSLVSLSLVAHTLDLLLGQTRRRLDADLLLLARTLILSRYVQDTVSVDVEGNLDLRNTTRSCGDTVQVEATNRLVVACHRALTLAYVDLYRGLVVRRGREYLALAGRNGGVSLDQLGEHTAQSLDTERQRSNIQQQHVLNLTGQNTTLNRSTDSYNLIGVHALVGGLTEELLYNLLDCGDTGRTTYEDNLVDLRCLQACVAQSDLTRLDGLAYQVVAQLLELSASQGHHQVLGNTVYGHNVGQVDLGRSGRRELDLSLLGSLLQALQCHSVLAQVDAVLHLERLGHIVDQYVVEVVTTQVSITIGRFNLEYAITQFKDRDIERTTTEVVNCDLHILVLLVHTVSQSCCGGLVDDTTYLQTSDLTSLLGSLALRVREVSGNGDHCLGNLSTQIVLSGLLHLLQDDSRDLLCGVLTAVDVNTGSVVVATNYGVGNASDVACNLIVVLTHKSLDREDRALGVGDSLTLCGIAHLALVSVGERNDRRSCAMTLAVGDYDGLVALHNCYTRVGST